MFIIYSWNKQTLEKRQNADYVYNYFKREAANKLLIYFAATFRKNCIFFPQSSIQKL